jgi:hypothetical protein
MAEKNGKTKGTKKVGALGDVLRQDIRAPVDCKLSDKELGQLAKDMAKNREQVGTKEASKKTFDDGIKADIALLDEAHNQLLALVRSGAKQREVDCTIEFDWRSKEVRLVRKDNKEILKRRTMTPEECQRTLVEKGGQAIRGALLLFDGGKKKTSDVQDDKKTDKADKAGKGDKAAATVGEPGLTATVGELAAAKKNDQGEKTDPLDKRLRDGAPIITDVLMVKKSKTFVRGHVVKVEGASLSIEVAEGEPLVVVDINSKDWRWPKEGEGEEAEADAGKPAKKRGRGKRALGQDDPGQQSPADDPFSS